MIIETWLFYKVGQSPDLVAQDFETCLNNKDIVSDSYPKRCQDRISGDIFLEKKENFLSLEKAKNLVNLDFPNEKDVVNNPLNISGKAIGTWFFEASFPVVLITEKGELLAESFVTAKENWMTEDFVNFQGELRFKKPSGVNSGFLLLIKDNPSGLKEYNSAIQIPVLF